MSRRRAGFTLAEAIIVIAITGIIATVVAVFLVGPVKGYFDTDRRAQLTDIADTALRRMARDLRQALPNSVRINAGTALEFLHVTTAGRYCEQGPCDFLDFTSGTDSSFDVLGPGVPVQAGNRIVVYNLGVPGADAYSSSGNPDWRAAAAPFGAALTTVTFTPTGAPFPFASPARRFQVVDMPVSYICSGSNLTRYWNYAIVAAQPNPPVGGSNALLASNVTSCSFTYGAGTTQRDALVTLQLQLTSGGETVSLIEQAHVNNVP
ncbi:MAG TPA: prepilin-type N-terminal cleavage/methylation domain-containing protein [Burkholderiales bacterium]|nr:prepilin-type N-terminal cleavage/methylation domain-containing protein [Burkholderiales bacterium]